MSQKRIVILGGGFGGAYCARGLEQHLDEDVEITLIDRNNYFVFYPLLVEAGTGSLEPRHVVVPLRQFLGRTRLLMGEILDADLDRREVRVRPAATEKVETVSYDHVVVAVGSTTRMPAVPGLREHGFEMNELGDAVELRDRAITMLEAAAATADTDVRRALLHFVVVGGNFTGAEVAGEFDVFLRDASRQYPGIDVDECHITLVELGDRILPALDPDLSAFAHGRLERRGVDIRLGTTVESIGPDEAKLSDGERLPTRTVIWCAGIAPAPLVRTLDLERDERGYVRCERTLRVVGRDDVWAIGDCAVNPDADGSPYPPTAQHAVRQGEDLARNIARVLRGREPRVHTFQTLGSLAALGCRTGVAKIGGLKLAGLPAWWLHRTVYLAKMPGLSRKVRVALDWTLDLLFPREVTQLGVHRPERPPGPRERR